MVAVIDFGVSNLKSVVNALEFLGADVCITKKADELEKAERIILPGVGTFSQGMKSLKKLKLVKPLEREVIKKKKPFLGICLGMQLLADWGSEGGKSEGLGWIGGAVKKFKIDNLKVPHIGWDDLEIKKNCLFQGIEKDKNFYFVHSYYFDIEEKDVVSATCNYGKIFPAALRKENIFATQFHPEKSQQNGLKVLENYLLYK